MGSVGIGFRIGQAASTLRTAETFAGILIVVVKIAAKALDMKEENSALAYDDVHGYWPKDGMPTLEGMKLSLEGVQKFGDIKGVRQGKG